MMKFFSNFFALTLNALRDRMNIFFNIFFPLMILIIFGFVFSGVYSPSNVKIGVIGNVPSVSGVSLKKFENIQSLKKAILKHKEDFGISLSATSLMVYLEPSNAQTNEYYISLAKRIAGLINEKMGTLEVIKVVREEVNFSNQKLSYLDSLIPGILALSIFSAGIFSMTASLAHLRDKKVIKKLWTTPILKWHFYGAFILEKVVETYISIIFLLVVAMVTFGIRYNVHWMNFSILLLSSIFAMMGIGMMILLFSPNAKIASEISSVIYTVVMFFSGVYFPVEIMPKFMQRIAYSLPIIYVVNAMKYVFGLKPMSKVAFYELNFVMFVGFILVLFGFSKMFRSE